MRLRTQVLGALNLFRADPTMLERSDLAVARTLQSRILIEQANGIIAQSGGIAVDEAFSRLRRFARSGGRRLTGVAQEVVDGTIRSAEILGVNRWWERGCRPVLLWRPVARIAER